MADKPVLVSVTWAHTIFRFFETFCKDASRSKLRGKKNRIFWTYGSKVIDVWSFEEKYGQGGHVLEPARVDYISPKRWAVILRKALWEFPLQSFEPCPYT
jgi:hypothetical protein